MNGKTLLPDPSLIKLECFVSSLDAITVVVKARQPQALCPLCEQSSRKIHSRYLRNLADLPWQGAAIRLELTVRRFFCINDDCSLLRERVVHTEEIYGKEKVDLAAFKKDLKENIAAYQKFIKDVAIPGEIRWRGEQMEEVRDSRLPTRIRDYCASQVQLLGHDVLVHYYKSQARESYKTALQANVGDPAMLWTLLDPDQANGKPIPMDRVWWVGPCTGLTEKGYNEHRATDRVLVEDRPGVPKKIYVREYNEVDYLQLFYEGHDGGGAGNRNGGEAHTIEIPAGVYVNRVETWWDWELSGIKFYFTNGKDTGVLGNRTGMGRHVESAAYPGHRLSSIRMEGNGEGVGKNALSFGFSPLPNYYDPKP